MQIFAGGLTLNNIAQVFLSAGITFLIASILSYFFLYLVFEFQHAPTIRPLKPLLNVSPESVMKPLFIPPLAIYLGASRLWDGIRTMFLEAVRTKTFTEFHHLDNGTRFRARGKAVPNDYVKAPITQGNAVVVFWAIDGWTGKRWKTEEQELRSGRFYVESINDYGENDRVFVGPDEDTEYSVVDGSQTIVEIEKEEPIPEYLRSFIQQNAPFAPDKLRFREVVVAPGDPVSVFGELYEENIDGVWEKVVHHPSEDGMNVIVSTESVSRLTAEVWRDATSAIIWGLLFLGVSFITLGFAGFIPPFI